ncbi:FecR family protein [Mucilaginibacter sp.]|uniref:FecR family protein n=1 Tax=Mucilaginibacter sp. TaxID=1882438 RepID=UPI0026248B90|nr:FecR family protein [Mucilaginibacter sp.]MDB4925504.1 FecR family protein [Mucilaginibacter sp.]
MQDTDVAQFINQESFLNYCFNRNDEDVRYWEKWLIENPEHVLQVEAMKQILILMAQESRGRLKQQHFSELQEKIKQSSSPQIIKKISLWPRYAVAASILLFLSIGGYYIFHKQPTQQTAQIQKQDIAPGGNKAILTLANGQRLILTGAKNGLLANQGNTTINKTADGKVVYNAAASESDKVIYNTMTTPRGGQYHLTLVDGTDVWLNAMSSIKYPTAFTGKDRQVEITGEAYFEVAHNPAKPFRIMSSGQTVEVLGTHFNVNGYPDESETKTTLIQGSVKVTKTGTNETNILKPGQQAILSDRLFAISNVKTDDAIAWKNGYFMFNNEPLESVMRKISRWYDVDIEYRDSGLKKENTYGSLSRFSDVSKVLKLLELTGAVKFHIAGNKIIVSKN